MNFRIHQDLASGKSYEDVFTLNEKEKSEATEWLKKHDKTCKYKKLNKQGAIGGRITYKFTPTSLGVIIVVECTCGKKIDITDVDSW